MQRVQYLLLILRYLFNLNQLFADLLRLPITFKSVKENDNSCCICPLSTCPTAWLTIINENYADIKEDISTIRKDIVLK
jgi:hypothetical protein